MGVPPPVTNIGTTAAPVPESVRVTFRIITGWRKNESTQDGTTRIDRVKRMFLVEPEATLMDHRQFLFVTFRLCA